jgi:hypothetical protein
VSCNKLDYQYKLHNYSLLITIVEGKVAKLGGGRGPIGHHYPPPVLYTHGNILDTTMKLVCRNSRRAAAQAPHVSVEAMVGMGRRVCIAPRRGWAVQRADAAVEALQWPGIGII